VELCLLSRHLLREALLAVFLQLKSFSFIFPVLPASFRRIFCESEKLRLLDGTAQAGPLTHAMSVSTASVCVCVSVRACRDLFEDLLRQLNCRRESAMTCLQ
jgi:hypothetical protein